MKKKNFSVIGKPLRKIDAMAKCAGETVFADDLNLPRTIYAKLLRSPHPHARVLGINAARALKLEGVYAVLTGEDLPEKFGIMPSTQDEEALVTDKARYAGDPVAAVAAATESLAEKALGFIDVDYEVLKPIHDRRSARFDRGEPAHSYLEPPCQYSKSSLLRIRRRRRRVCQLGLYPRRHFFLPRQYPSADGTVCRGRFLRSRR